MLLILVIFAVFLNNNSNDEQFSRLINLITYDYGLVIKRVYIEYTPDDINNNSTQSQSC